MVAAVEVIEVHRSNGGEPRRGTAWLRQAERKAVGILAVALVLSTRPACIGYYLLQLVTGYWDLFASCTPIASNQFHYGVRSRSLSTTQNKLPMDARKLRGWWWRRQGLDGSLKGKKPAEILAQTGWSRSVGGVGPYLTLFSRGGISREDADAAVAKLQIHELPTARGCTYVVPASDFGLGLTVGREFNSDMKTAVKLGVTEKEVDKLCEAVVKALEKGPLDPDGIREATGKASRSLGEEVSERS